MIRLLSTLGLAALIAGCGSSVKLDEAPVEDRAGSAVSAQRPASAASAPASAGGGSAVAQSNVAGVKADAGSATAAGPTGVARLVLFDYDSYVVKPEFSGLIEGHARFLKANPTRRVSIEGHTDERGGREYNLALGQRRSEAVRRALTLLGASDSQIEAVSFGKEKPSAAGGGEASWAKNRRAEVVYR